MSDRYIEKQYHSTQYVKKRKKLSGIFFISSLPNEYLIQIGQKKIKPILGGKKFRLFRKFIRIPASVQTLYFKTDNANVDYQGIGIEGYASWRIDPDRADLAISTLDFFDEDDPVARTNNELRTICIEAVRYVVANMTIDDALKKKDEITENLKNQLKSVEDRWGIIFDQVGIENVRIMSNKLFENLQAQYRDNLRKEVARTRISTDKDIASQENAMREENELEKLESGQKIELNKVNNESKINEVRLIEKQKLSSKERVIREEEYRKDNKFKLEKEEKEHQLELLNKQLDMRLQETEKELLNSKKKVEEIQNEIIKNQLTVEKLKKEIEQAYSKEELINRLIEMLPEIYSSIEIDNYSVLDSGGNGNSISPVGKFLNELIFILKNSNFSQLFSSNNDVKMDNSDEKN